MSVDTTSCNFNSSPPDSHLIIINGHPTSSKLYRFITYITLLNSLIQFIPIYTHFLPILISLRMDIKINPCLRTCSLPGSLVTHLKLVVQGQVITSFTCMYKYMYTHSIFILARMSGNRSSWQVQHMQSYFPIYLCLYMFMYRTSTFFYGQLLFLLPK